MLFYVSPLDPNSPNYSVETATSLVVDPQEFEFVDQSDGDILQRYWVFGDGTQEIVEEPNRHTVKHTYQQPGEYEPSLIIVYNNQGLKKAYIKEKVIVI